MARKRGLQAADVVAVASALADREGLAAVTLARVASELGVQSPSLYSHVDGLPGLRRALALEAVGRLGECLTNAVGDREGADALVALAHAYRCFALEHPGLYAAMLPAPQPDDVELYAAFAEPVALMGRVLGGLGVKQTRAVHLVRGFRSAIHGFVTLEAGGGFAMPADVDTSFAAMVDLLVVGVMSRLPTV